MDDDNTTNCYVKLFAGSSARDVLLLGNIPANTQLWCQHRLNTMGSLRELFENYGKPNITSVEVPYPSIASHHPTSHSPHF